MLGFLSLLLEPIGVDAKPNSRIDPSTSRKSELGQFMTPRRVADYMAGSFDPAKLDTVRLLDAGAGQGALSIAFAQRWLDKALPGSALSIDAFEIDPTIAHDLRNGLTEFDQQKGISTRIFEGDFIAEAAALIARGERPYTHAILNPPYKKIANDSTARTLLRGAGIETVNLYSAFVALSLMILEDQGELVAIVPRSFCNGPYYRPFRELVLRNAAVASIHLFKARNKAFAGDRVLQENVIIHLKRGAVQGDVSIGTSTDASFSDLSRKMVSFDQVVKRDDPAKVIHIPVEASGSALTSLVEYRQSLLEIGLQVSTGPVVDFRVKPHLRDIYAPGAAPLLYPTHFSGGQFQWPRLNGRKPNALQINSVTAKMLYPHGFYVVVRRFSSKEEDRRIVASVVDPAHLPGSWIAFENHLNVFHRNRSALPETLARGLATYLNARIVDDWLRNFSGHTQVNATDLRSLPLPSHSRLQALGEWSMTSPAPTQAQVDAIVANPK